MRPLHEFYARGGLSDREFVFCRLLLYLPDTPLSDKDVSVILAFTPAEEFVAHRQTLSARGLLSYEFNPETGKYLYHPRFYNESALASHPPAPSPKAPQRRRNKPGKNQPPLSRWIVLEQGQRAHLLRPDDLFPAERTLCGIPATDAGAQPLPQFNCQPADYGICARCQLLSRRPKP